MTESFEVIESNLQKVKYFLNKEYLFSIKDDYVVYPFGEYNKGENNSNKINPYKNIGCVKVSLWIKNKEENIIDKFKNIFTALEHTGKTVAFAITRYFDTADFYFFVKIENSDLQETILYRNLLSDAISGNFPGSKTDFFPIFDDNDNKEKKYDELYDSLFGKEDSLNSNSSISIVNAVATEKSEKFVSQGIEKLLDGIIPNKNESYTILFLAESLRQEEILKIKKGFEDITTAITPYIQYQDSKGSSKTESNSSTQSLSHSHGINESISKTNSNSIGGSVNVGGKLGPINVGGTVSYNHSWAKTKTQGFSDTDTTGTSTGKILSDGITKNTTLTHVSAELKNYSKMLEQEIDLLNLGKALGMWKSAAYVLAPTKNESLKISNFLKSLIQGEKSIVEPSFVQVWSKDDTETNGLDYQEIRKYIRHFVHPIFLNKKDCLERNEHSETDIASVTITNYVTTKELAAQMSFPQKAVPGMPVIDCVPFGREVTSLAKESSRKIELGKIYHMRQVEPKSVDLDLNSLTSHVFVTGSTGSGKSNTVYQLLRKAHKNGVKFLVVEPAKGEYKSVFGKETDVHIYGTNPKQTKLLKLNPFRFDVKTTMLHEHIDRLISIFNVCWPMYAAMPAVLKQAVEKSYADCGWDLSNPWKENEYDNNYFPCFADVARNVVEIINSSDYDNENKGAYKGSLVTRLTSLTNGFFGMIFTSKDDIDKDELFDQNVIVDLSHVGSPETKSLIMGIIMLKLQEYRMGSGKINSELNHLTVLEEAHNLLKRTSTDVSSESGNLQGRSVEMISNAIAEMRTYGEGFIIADQAPGLLDMAAIRNTNTKIIMRLPDYDDRRLVGKAANLTDEQIDELARLSIGVAAVYQNNWVQSVLCQMDKFESDQDCSYEPDKQPLSEDLKQRGKCLEDLFRHKKIDTAILNELYIADSLKVTILNYQKTYDDYPVTIGKIVTQLCPKGEKRLLQLIDSKVNASKWAAEVYNAILCYLNDTLEESIISKVIQSIMDSTITEGTVRDSVIREWIDYKNSLTQVK